jgi:hypothetical protein
LNEWWEMVQNMFKEGMKNDVQEIKVGW